MLQVQNSVMLLLSLVLFVIKGWALIDAIIRDPRQFFALGSMSKNGWLILLGLAIAAHLVFWNPLSLLNLAGTLAALVYLAQTRATHL